MKKEKQLEISQSIQDKDKNQSSKKDEENSSYSEFFKKYENESQKLY